MRDYCLKTIDSNPSTGIHDVAQHGHGAKSGLSNEQWCRAIWSNICIYVYTHLQGLIIAPADSADLEAFSYS